MNRTKSLPENLKILEKQIMQHALDYGLSFYDVRFEICDYDTINILAAQGGFPSRYPHWRLGMDYDQLSKGNTYGTQKIYEMVINTDPCYAYLLSANHLVDQKIVMAHVYGHADFFKNNFWFKTTNRQMMDVCANHGAKIRRYMDKYGIDKVERFIDRVLSLENLLDVSVLFETTELKRRRQELDLKAKEEKDNNVNEGCSVALKSFMSSQKRQAKKEGAQATDGKEEHVETEELSLKMAQFPVNPVKDIMGFLSENAPLQEWEADIVGMLREEAYYFLPQRMTKIMNEGWASYWHSKIMTEKVMHASEMIDFADHHSSVMQMSPQRINPYKIGLELFRDIEYRWNRGMFGKEFNECQELNKKENWNLNLGLGRDKIFEVRRTHNDITFIDEFLTPEFCNRNQLFTYKFNPRSGQFEIESREFKVLKEKLLASLTNFGQPVISVIDANYNNSGQLFLAHQHFQVDLDLNKAKDTLKNIYALWKRPVNIKTVYEEKPVIFQFDGKEFKSL